MRIFAENLYLCVWQSVVSYCCAAVLPAWSFGTTFASGNGINSITALFRLDGSVSSQKSTTINYEPRPDRIRDYEKIKNANFYAGDRSPENDEADEMMPDWMKLSDCARWCDEEEKCRTFWYIRLPNAHICELFKSELPPWDLTYYDDLEGKATLYSRAKDKRRNRKSRWEEDE